jgi:hypothetical protein
VNGEVHGGRPRPTGAVVPRKKKEVRTSYHINSRIVNISPFFIRSQYSNLIALLSLFLWLYSHFVGLWPLLSFLILYTVDRTPWTGNQPVSKSLPTNRTQTHTDIHALNGVQTHSVLTEIFRVSPQFLQASTEIFS